MTEDGRPLNQFENQRALFHTVNDGDIGVIERRQNLRFPLKACQPLRIVREGIGQNLDGDFAIELGVGGAIDFAHTAHTDALLDAIVPDYSARLERLCGVPNGGALQQVVAVVTGIEQRNHLAAQRFHPGRLLSGMRFGKLDRVPEPPGTDPPDCANVVRSRSSDFAGQPCLGKVPVAANGVFGNSENLRRLLQAQAAKETEFHDRAFARIFARERLDGIIEGEQFPVGGRGRNHVLVECDVAAIRAPFAGTAGAAASTRMRRII